MLALIALALQPLHQTAWARERRSHAYKNTSIFAPRFTFAPRMTRASSWNVGKFYRTVKLFAKNLHLFHADGHWERCYFTRGIVQHDMTGTYVHNSTICRTMQYLGFRKKRLQRITLQCSDDLRGKFVAEISLFNPAMIVWVDESGFNRRNTIRAYSYSLQGMHAIVIN